MLEDVKQAEINKLYLDYLDNLPESVVICDEKFDVTYVNNKFLKLYGSKIQNVLNKKLETFIENTSSTDCDICRHKPAKHIVDESRSHQASFINSDGEAILIRVHHGLTSDRKNFISTFFPMTDLACIDQAQVDFVSTVSHELRTPMTSIKGFADTLLLNGDQLTKEQQTRFMKIIKSQADRLTRLVENLLTVSRLETKTHKSQYRSLNLEKFVERVFLSLKTKHPLHKFITQFPDGLPNLWADQDKLEQVLTNLIDNAAKYSKEGSTVRVTASLLPNDADKMQFKVIDEGIGIPEEYLSQIFNKFSRIDNPLTRQVQGTGLGLYITKALTESMGGSISVSSDTKGTIFTVTMNVATPEKQAKQGLLSY